jgi:NAD(P)-dependent dehydrogenase (short-subunit alcohol dehydrogenase family)
MKLKEKVAIVTGGSQGIGRGIVTVFAGQGAKVVVADRDAKNGEDTAAEARTNGGEARFVPCDVADELQIKTMVDRTLEAYGRIDILVNNAGVGVYKSVLDASVEDWDRCLTVDLKGVFLCSKYVIPHMLRLGKGVIINISSVHSARTASGTGPYAAAKGGATALTRSMAIDFGPTIRVNAISPGWVLTPLVEKLFDSYPDPAAQRRLIEQRQVMKRIGTPRDIGDAAAFLASDEASFITGTELFVDGGLTAVLETW